MHIMSSAKDTETALWCIVAACAVKIKQEKKKKKRKVWTKDWLLGRRERDIEMQLIRELAVNNETDIQNNVGLPLEVFFSLLTKVKPLIEKEDTLLRDSISASARLEATLLFLATGAPYSSLQYLTRISKQSLSKIIPETCQAIYQVLKDNYLKVPRTPEDWLEVAEQYERKWDFPHCLGSIGGKYVQIRPRTNCASNCYNYRGIPCIAFMAIADANYEFIFVDVVTNGRVSDGDVWSNSLLCDQLEDGAAGLPRSAVIPGTGRNLPFIFVADDALPLKSYIAKPFLCQVQTNRERVFSYRLSRARRTVENAFGILTDKFRVFQSAINLEPKKVESIVFACTVLHNLLLRDYPHEYIPKGTLDNEVVEEGRIDPGAWRLHEPTLGLEGFPSEADEDAIQVRENFTNYFNAEGAVPWQNKMVGLELGL